MEKVRVNYEKMYYGFPIILVSYYDEIGVPNITTLSSSFTLKNMICLGFGSKGYALNQIKKVKDFAINIPDRSIMKGIDISGSYSGIDTNKFEKSGFTSVKSDIINAPLIKECPISIECTFADIMEKDFYKGYTVVLAEIKGRCISTELISNDNQLRYSSVDPVLYVGNGEKCVYRYTEKNSMNDLKAFL